MPRLASDRGQSTLEYVAVAALLVVLVSAAGAAAMTPTYVNAAWGGVQRALCIVTGRECRSLTEQACVVRANSERNTLTATIAFVRLEDGRLLLQERLSDGRIRITVTDTSGIGGEVGVGASGGIDLGGVKLDASAVANASLLGLYGRGTSYVVRDAGQAQRLVKQIENGDARYADVTFHEGGLRADGAASAGVEASIGGATSKGGKAEGGGERSKDGEEGSEEQGGTSSRSDALAEASAEVKASLTRAIGHRKDRRTGETTWYLRADNEVSASAGASVVAAGGAGAEASAHANGVLSVTTDRKGRVVAVGALATYGAGAGYHVSGGPSGSAGGRRHEIEVTADPDDPEILAALRGFGESPGPSTLKALTQAVYDRGRIDRRAYEVGQDSKGAGASLALGAKVGAGYEQSTEQARLVDASTRPPGGVWEERFDCVDRA